MIKRITHTGRSGFTLIEILVSVAIFSIIMTISLGALLSMSEANRKVQVLSSTINNLSFALDSMSRSIRTGDGYPASGSWNSTFLFTAFDGSAVTYCLSDSSGIGCGTSTSCTSGSCRILRSINTGSGDIFVPLTVPEIQVTKFGFFVQGTVPSDKVQPKVSILISGVVPVTSTRNSVFNLQTSITQRMYDL